MKNVIVTVALSILFIGAVLFNNDLSNYQKAQYFLKNTADRGLAGAALYIDEQQYGEGYYVFKDVDIVEYVSLFAGADDYQLYIWDDRLQRRTYTRDNGELKSTGQLPFVYGSFFMDPYDGEKVRIEQPAIIIILERNGLDFRSGYDVANTVRSTMYVVEGR